MACGQEPKVERHTAVPEVVDEGISDGRVVSVPERVVSIPEHATSDQLRESVQQERATRRPKAEWSRIDPERALVSTARRTFILAEPHAGATRLGYLKSGSVVARQPEPASTDGCAEGFYGIEPEGYVCIGKDASLNMRHPLVEAAQPGPNGERALPYTYAISRYPTPPFYTRIPTVLEQQRTEEELHYHLPRRSMTDWLKLPLSETPKFLLDGAPSFHTNGLRKSKLVVADGRALVQSGFGLLRQFEADGRYFGLTTDYDVLPLDRMDPVSPSVFRGVELRGVQQLPVAFVRARHAYLYRGSGAQLTVGRRIKYREAFSLTGRRHRVGNHRYLETVSGDWIRKTSRVVEVELPERWPRWATPGRTWIDVSILKQTLVAYEGETPRYVTLVSTGADGIRDPETSMATVQGQFLTHTKHLTASMSGSDEDGAFDLREVPYVQYFSGGYALHAAYWHDNFGSPRSHGCVNLSPLDAQWLFQWTEPALPAGWHGVMSLRNGTLVHIHP